MPSFDKINDVLGMLKKAQDVEEDNREMVRGSYNFLEKKDGQWQPSVISKMGGRYRGTFDKCNKIVDRIAASINRVSFGIRVRPAGGEATKDIALTLGGMVRNIENMSNASNIYKACAREMIAGGISGCEVVQEWADGDSIEQDLLIKRIPNFEDRVWLDPNAEEQDASDAMWGVILTQMGKDEYDKEYPEGSGTSVSTENCSEVYTQKRETVTVGRILYRKPIKKELVLFSDGSVREATDELESVIDDLAAQGITEKRRRTRDSWKVFSRIFDGKEFLTKEQETVFKWIPIIPNYGNFAIREGKVIYRGDVIDRMDSQRVLNYSRSREVEEVALAPRAKYWLSEKQAQGHTETLSTLNTNADPVQIYTPDPDAPPPQQQGGAVPNAGLQLLSQSSAQDLSPSSTFSGIQNGEIDGPMSGTAIQAVVDQGEMESDKYMDSQEVFICHIYRVLVDAIPLTYDTERQVRVLQEDDSFDMVSLNDRVFDAETQQFVVANDLSKGKYDVTCDVGPAFKNRQQETVKALESLYSLIPGLAPLTADIALGSVASPGVDLAQERVRMKLVQSGEIPESQLTDEEREQIQAAQQAAAQQPPQPDPQAEFVQAQTMDVMSKAQERQDNAQLKAQKLELEQQKIMLDAQDKAESRDLDEAAQIIDQQRLAMQQQQQQFEQVMGVQMATIKALNEQAQTLKTLREAQGVDAIVGPHTVEAYANQAELVTQSQDAVSPQPETDTALNLNNQDV